MANERRKIYTGIIRTLQNIVTTEKMVVDVLNTRLQDRKIAAAATRFTAINGRLQELLKEAELLEQVETRADVVKEAEAIQTNRMRGPSAPSRAEVKKVAPKKVAPKKVAPKKVGP